MYTGLLVQPNDYELFIMNPSQLSPERIQKVQEGIRNQKRLRRWELLKKTIGIITMILVPLMALVATIPLVIFLTGDNFVASMFGGIFLGLAASLIDLLILRFTFNPRDIFGR